MVKRLRSVPAPQTMVANAVPAPVFGPISQVHVTLPTAFARAEPKPLEPETTKTNFGTNGVTRFRAGASITK